MAGMNTSMRTVSFFVGCAMTAWHCAPWVELAEGEGGKGGGSGASTLGGGPAGGDDGQGSTPAGDSGASSGGGGNVPGSAGDSASGGGEPQPAVCAFGQDHTCNDDPNVSALWGRCEVDGACSCSPGFTINDRTGKCRRDPNLLSPCAVPFEQAPCKDLGPLLFYFDLVTGTCKQTRVSCGGRPTSGTVYQTLAECEGACIQPD